MKKKNFISLVLGTAGGLLFAIGMCMCLLPEWNAFTPGIVLAAIGAVTMLVLLIVRRKTDGKPSVKLNKKTIGTVALSIAGALIFGTGMCMTMVWEGMMIPGIIVGIVGIMAMLFIIPLCKGLK